MCFWRCNAFFASASLIVGLNAAGVAGVAPAHLLMVNGLDKGGFETHPVAKPSHASQTWEQRETAFAWRVHKAFEIPSGRALEFAGWILEAARPSTTGAGVDRQPRFSRDSSFRKRARIPVRGHRPER